MEGKAQELEKAYDSCEEECPGLTHRQPGAREGLWGAWKCRACVCNYSTMICVEQKMKKVKE